MDRLNSPLAADQLRFAVYLEALSGVLSHVDRIAPLKVYCMGLLLPGARKSIEPMAARIAPARVQATHQALHHFVAKDEWSDSALLARVRSEVLPLICDRGLGLLGREPLGGPARDGEFGPSGRRGARAGGNRLSPTRSIRRRPYNDPLLKTGAGGILPRFPPSPRGKV